LSVAYRFLNDGNIAIHDERWLTYPWGVNGGTPGQRSTKILKRADGTQQILPAKCDGVEVKEGDLLYFNTWGGGGWGDPFLRDCNNVLDDVNRGLVSIEGAKRYGVVIVDGAVDQQQTTTLRADLTEKRGATQLFDFGGTIEEIKARCLQETGLPAPETPRFVKSRA
jgi:N-methylhydantoinase B